MPLVKLLFCNIFTDGIVAEELWDMKRNLIVKVSIFCISILQSELLDIRSGEGEYMKMVIEVQGFIRSRLSLNVPTAS